MPPNRYNGVKISPTAAKRIFAASRFIEQQPRSKAPGIAGPVDFGGAVMLHVTTACNPMSGASPGVNGRGKIQQFNGTSYSDLSSTVYPIINDTEKTVAIGAYVLCCPGPGGQWHWLGVDKCANLS